MCGNIMISYKVSVLSNSLIVNGIVGLCTCRSWACLLARDFDVKLAGGLAIPDSGKYIETFGSSRRRVSWQVWLGADAAPC